MVECGTQKRSVNASQLINAMIVQATNAWNSLAVRTIRWPRAEFIFPASLN